MTLPVRIVVRTNTPWERMTKEEFYKQDSVLLPQMAVTETKQKRSVHLWEEAYKRSFCMYRAMIRDACMIEHKRVKPDNITVGIDNVDWSSSDEILLPIDDDDTYESGIVDTLKASFRDNTNIVLWPRRTNFLGRDRIESCTRYLDTCNWAIRKSFLEHWCLGDKIRLLAFHWVASGMVYNKLFHREFPNTIMGHLEKMRNRPSLMAPLNHETVVELDKPWSTYYLHSGSISFLDGRKMAQHSDTVEYLRGLPLHPLL
jgi:hypothetical protein